MGSGIPGYLRAALALVTLLVAGCLESPLVPCGDTACPPGNVCTAGGCATPADIEACSGLAEGSPCQASTGVTGTCLGGGCQTNLCGNDSIDLGEECDDGNQTSGDGCRADCAKIERCGDGVEDEGEACDDGNQNTADGCDACAISMWGARTVVGSPTIATTSALAQPNSLSVDGLGRIYFADTENHRVRRIELDGSVSTVAGTGTPGFSGDAGQATSAQLRSPGGVVVDGIGRVFIADTDNHRIRLIELDGTISTIAGTGTPGNTGNGTAAILAQLHSPRGIAVDGLGRVFFADTDNHSVRRIEIDGTIKTIAGVGAPGFAGDGDDAVTARLDTPFAVAVDPTGRVLIADTANQRIRSIDANGLMSTVAGDGSFGFSGDNGPATGAAFSSPIGLAIDATGRVYVADTLNNRLRRFTIGGTITTVAGTGTAGFAGDGGAATTAQLQVPIGVAVDGLGRVVVADTQNQRIRRIDDAGVITTLAGNGTYGFGGDGGAATSSQLATPFGLALDAMGRLYIADALGHRVRRVELDGTIITVAGTGQFGFSGDGGLATAAQLRNPNYITLDATGRLIIADTFNHRIRRVELDGTIHTIAGTGSGTFGGDGGQAINAQLRNPNGIVVDAQGRLIIADTYNLRIRRIELDGTITTIAGTGSFTYNGDNIAATAAALAYPYSVALDTTGRLLIADSGNNRIRAIATDGIITTIAGNGEGGDSGDDGPATAARIHSPHSVTVDAQGRIAFADEFNSRIRYVEGGMIRTIAGDGTLGDRGDAAAATMARLNGPTGLVLDMQGRLIIGDSNNNRVRRFTIGGVIETIAGTIDPANIGPVATARLADPQAILVTPDLTIVAGGTSGTVEIVRDGRVVTAIGRYPQSAATGALARYRTAGFGDVGGVALDSTTGKIYLTETTANRIHVVTPVGADPSTWTIESLANTAGQEGSSDGPAATARFRTPTGLYLDETTRMLYVADTGNHAIRAIDLASSTVSTLVNQNRRLGFAGDGGPARDAQLFRPRAITRCARTGDLFIADTSNNRIRRIVMATGTISTVLGDGIPASSGEGEPAIAFPVDAPRGLACDDFGNLFVSSSTAVRLLPATDMGVVDGTGDVKTIYGAPPRSAFPASVTSCLSGLAVTGAKVQVADACTGLLVELERTTP